MGEMRSVADPGDRSWDLVVVHTVHSEDDLAWIGDAPLVLDTTYRLAHLPNATRL